MRPPRQYSVRLSEVFVLIVDRSHIVYVWIEKVIEMLWWMEVSKVFLEQPDNNTYGARYGFKKRTNLFELRHTAFWFF